MRRGVSLLIALASIAACSGTIAPAGETRPSASSDAAAPRPGRPIGDVPDPRPDASGPATGDCPGAFTDDAVIKPFASPMAVCSEEDLATLAQLAPPPKGSYVADEAAVRARNDACASCLFGKESDAEWRAIVYVGGLGQAFVDYGACFARSPGGNDACGKAIERQRLCIAQVCDIEICGTADAVEKCIAEASPHCHGAEVQKACGDALPDLSARCATLVDVARVLCGPPR